MYLCSGCGQTDSRVFPFDKVCIQCSDRRGTESESDDEPLWELSLERRNALSQQKGSQEWGVCCLYWHWENGDGRCLLLSWVVTFQSLRRCAHAECRRSTESFHSLHVSFHLLAQHSALAQLIILLLYTIALESLYRDSIHLYSIHLQEEAVKAATCALLYQSEATVNGSCANFRGYG